jgi:phosphonatase-like hydrolase
MEAFEDSGILITHGDAQQVMGYKKSDAIHMLLRQHGENAPDLRKVEKIHQRFIEGMIRFYETTPDLKPFEDTEDLFRWLRKKDVRVALNTGFSSAVTNIILNRLHWRTGEIIDGVISSDEVARGRPAPDMIFEMMNRLQISDPLSVVKVGDTQSDVEEGRQAGCGLVVGTTTGAYSREQLEIYQPDHIIDNLESLKVILNRNA